MSAQSPQERQTAVKVLASNLAYIGAFGGLLGVPFMFLIKFLWNLVEDDPDKDPEKLIREHTNKPIGRAITRGIPAMFGNDMSWRVEGTDILDIPIGFQTIKTIKGRFDKGVRAFEQHDYWGAVFQASPDMMMNPYKAVVGYKEGGEKKSAPAIKYTKTEAMIKGAGFTPTREAETYKAQELSRKKRDQRLKKIAEWTERYIVALREKDTQSALKIYQEVSAYNKTERLKGASGVGVSWKKDIEGGLKRKVKSRAKGYDESLPQYMRQYQQETGKAFKLQSYGDQ
jgi:hypothetical protein